MRQRQSLEQTEFGQLAFQLFRHFGKVLAGGKVGQYDQAEYYVEAPAAGTTVTAADGRGTAAGRGGFAAPLALVLRRYSFSDSESVWYELRSSSGAICMPPR